MSKYFTTQLLCKFNRLTLYSELNDEGKEGEDDVDDMRRWTASATGPL